MSTLKYLLCQERKNQAANEKEKSNARHTRTCRTPHPTHTSVEVTPRTTTRGTVTPHPVGHEELTPASRPGPAHTPSPDCTRHQQERGATRTLPHGRCQPNLTLARSFRGACPSEPKIKVHSKACTRRAASCPPAKRWTQPRRPASGAQISHGDSQAPRWGKEANGTRLPSAGFQPRGARLTRHACAVRACMRASAF